MKPISNHLDKVGIPIPKEVTVPTEDRAAANESHEDEVPTDSGGADDCQKLLLTKIAVSASNNLKQWQ